MPHTVTTVGVSLINPPQAITISPSALTGCGRVMRLGSQRPVPYTESVPRSTNCARTISYALSNCSPSISFMAF